jgi:hypothetical protein
MSSSLNFYAYLASPPARVISSAHLTLEELEVAISCAQSLKLSHVLVHVGLRPIDEKLVLEFLEPCRPGIYKTAVAAAVLPETWIPESMILPGAQKATKRVAPSKNEDKQPRAKPGRKVNPDSALSQARLIFAAMHPSFGALEIKRRIAEKTGVDINVANTYFHKILAEDQVLPAACDAN